MARLNENENENENESTGRSGLFAGSLYNTYKIAKQAFGTVARAPRIPGYDEMAGWDGENKGWVYVMEFAGLDVEPNKKWYDELRTVAESKWQSWEPKGNQPPADLDKALGDIVDAAGEREDRFAEILHQRDAEGCIAYWVSMLGIDPAKQSNTYQLIRVARKLGEMIVMRLKADFNAARPSQICPAIVPMFDPPRTASYPAGHSLQSYLISYLLLRAMLPEVKPEHQPKTWGDVHEGLFALARRVADNRVIAGVHFDIDSEAGFFIAKTMDEWFGKWLAKWRSVEDRKKRAAGFPEFRNFGALLDAAADEFPQWKAS